MRGVFPHPGIYFSQPDIWLQNAACHGDRSRGQLLRRRRSGGEAGDRGQREESTQTDLPERTNKYTERV